MADSKAPSAAPQDNEHNEPGDMMTNASSGMEAPPMWMWGIIFAALFIGVFFLGANLGGSIGPDPWPRAAMADGDVVTVAAAPAIDGAPIYSNRCIACHQAGGTGMPGLFPPLAGSEWVTGDPDNVIRIVLNGLQGPIEVAGESYNSVMPGLATQLNDEEVAAVITHVRSSFGNSASAISVADVARLRGEEHSGPWTADDLHGMAGSSPAPAPVVASTPPPTQSTPVATVAAVSGGSPGADLFAKFACTTCHAVDSPAAGAGPSLYDAGTRLSRGEIYQSIADPDAVIADGYNAGVMSAMLAATNFTSSELKELVDYLTSLKG